MAAVLVCRPEAALSHRSAAALWGIGTELRGRIDVTLRRRGEVRRPGIRARARPSLPPTDLAERLGIPVTAIVRTFLDIATELGPRALERAVNEADKKDLIDPDALRAALDHHAGRPGVRALRAVLDPHTFRLSDDELELLFRPLAAAAGLQVQLTKIWVNGFEVDFFWPDLGLVVETDGWRYHRTPAAQTRAARRDQVHTAAGLTPLRFSHWQVKHEPAYVRAILERTVAHLGRGRPARSPGK
jgi:very-short-patch-repair endonuclease